MKRLAMRFLVLLSVLLTLSAAAWVLWTWTNGGVVQAYVPPRPTQPTVEQVKIFGCTYTGCGCADIIEDRTNTWLQQQQPGIHIRDRKLVLSEGRLVLAVFYETPDRRSPKSPAEAQ